MPDQSKNVTFVEKDPNKFKFTSKYGLIPLKYLFQNNIDDNNQQNYEWKLWALVKHINESFAVLKPEHQGKALRVKLPEWKYEGIEKIVIDEIRRCLMSIGYTVVKVQVTDDLLSLVINLNETS